MTMITKNDYTLSDSLVINLQGMLREGITQEDIIATFKGCLNNYFDKIFVIDPKLTFIKDKEEPIEIKDKNISVKSNVKRCVRDNINVTEFFSPKYQYVYPDKLNIKALVEKRLKGLYIKRDN
jgi:hypothetical protein